MSLMLQSISPNPLITTYYELADWDPQCFGQPRQNDNGRVPGATLNAAYIGPVKAGFEG